MFVSRQPIYNRSIDLFAYELIYPFDVLERTIAEKSEPAGVEFFLNTLLSTGLESLVGDTLAFIHITRPMILQDDYKAIPKERVVLEISREIEPDAAVLGSLSALTKSGYKIALDDFNDTEQTRPILELADFVSVNFKNLSAEDIPERLARLKQSKVKAIAKGIETHADSESAKSMGFEYFKGSCFIKPKLTTSTRVPVNRLSTLQLVLKLQEPELSTAEFEKIISQDLAISYKLLQYVNSAAFSLPETSNRLEPRSR